MPETIKRVGKNPTLFCVLMILHSVFLVETLDPSARLCSFLLARVERMTFGTDFHVDLFLCGTDCKCIAAVTGNCCLLIFRMNSFFHCFHLFRLQIALTA